MQLVENIDAGNTNSDEDTILQAIDCLNTLMQPDRRMSKYQAYNYIGVSRATFDNYVRAGLLPKGKHQQGFKELSWSQKDLNEFLSKQHEKNK